METDETSRLPHPLHFLWAALLAIGFLGLVVLILPEPSSMSPQHQDEPSAPRQHVLVLLVDSTDHVDAHGEHVRSVIQRFCSACEVRHINVHGNMSTARLQLALKEVREIIRGVEPSTTVIVNLSWGTYAYNAAMHEVIRSLHQLGAVMIASAGNDNTSKPFYPAAFDEVLGICSSSRYRKTKAAYSNFGSWVSLCAPGLHYVSQPLEHVGIASGTSFASPMVSGVLGQHLLDAPCATPGQGKQALLRTADPFPDATPNIAIGRLNREAAAHYLNTLYGCQVQPTIGMRVLKTLRRVSSNVALFFGLLVYAVVSIFAFPFLFAYLIERVRLRAEQQLNRVIQMAYTESAAYRSQRLDTLKQRCGKSGRLRHREATELAALLHAQHLFDEPCGWCEGQQLILSSEALSSAASLFEDQPLSICVRCGLKPEASTLSL
ncbi:MAG: hypothetical protein ETSY1_35370 [Candidatus Entotheonella factor]|uniref:Peptidase S8/S53 domain-containing protein n=1 Tax=Entotheonella factor TaxID=1429438 RepID=W4L8X9_ENTF1|nr:MAG: hypothetical protein ETSY1_35370 [Candidatus Entotheonella factor]